MRISTIAAMTAASALTAGLTLGAALDRLTHPPTTAQLADAHNAGYHKGLMHAALGLLDNPAEHPGRDQ